MLEVVKCPNCQRRLFDMETNIGAKAEIVKKETGEHQLYIKCSCCKKIIGIKKIY